MVESGREPRTGRRIALWGTALIVAAIAMELARNDHGFGEPFFWLAFVVVPVVLIFGASAEGARRWYGWPDLGPTPARAALLSAAFLAGVLVGNRVHADDVVETKARGERLARRVREWREANRGVWPARLEHVDASPARTRLGAIAPPPFAYDPADATLSFPLGRGSALALDVTTEGASWQRR